METLREERPQSQRQIAALGEAFYLRRPAQPARDAGPAARWVWLPLLVGLAVVLMRGGQREKVIALARKILPPVQRISEKLSSSRIAGMLGMMLSGGFPIENALEMSANALEGTDEMHVSVCGNDERILLVARFDNLGKGACGAAIQNMNLMIGAPEDLGLIHTGEIK